MFRDNIIQYTDVVSQDIDGISVYRIFFQRNDCSEKLLTLKADDNYNITEISVTASGSNINKKDRADLSLLSKAVISIFTENEDNAAEVLSILNATSGTSKNNRTNAYYSTHRFSYYLIENEIGIIFDIKKLSYEKGTDEQLTLRASK